MASVVVGMSKALLAWRILRQRSLSYVWFRCGYELKRRVGLLRSAFPTDCPQEDFVSLIDWRKSPPPFFFESKSQIDLPQDESTKLKEAYDHFCDGKVQFFSDEFVKLGRDYDWVTNPDTGYRYDIGRHWTEIDDFSAVAGDIKYCWEKSRFSYLYTLIRYDYHFGVDCGELVFSEIESWIAANPINMGPNYRCSQEISLRVLNWTFALYYYRESESLSPERFRSIVHSIYWQIHHVDRNIGFSLNCVRNNHAITEALILYLCGFLFPFFPESTRWSREGKIYLEQELEYQVYDDGTFIQHSHNYHRVLIQLLSWALGLSQIHSDSFADSVLVRARRTLDYLLNATDRDSGHLPNFGLNDGALFFPLNNCDYRDFRPQLNALHFHLYGSDVFAEQKALEDSYWFGRRSRGLKPLENHSTARTKVYPNSGIYTVRNNNTFLFIQCASYQDRPFQADNLHLDFWHDGVNVLRDAGTYKYNASDELTRYFNGTSSHNTIGLGDEDQMRKGPRFMWFDWSRCLSASLKERPDGYYFSGKIEAFRHLDRGIQHTRRVFMKRDVSHLRITDLVDHRTQLPMRQYWNISPEFESLFHVVAVDSQERVVEPKWQQGFYSDRYGVKKTSRVLVFETYDSQIDTVIQVK